MRPDQWSQFYPYFTPEECGDDMNINFMRPILQARIEQGKAWRVLDGSAQAGHSPNSMHYQGRALDFWVDDNPRHTLHLLDSYGFGAVGVYYWGATYDRTGIPFFHVDNRESDRYQRWKSPESGKYIYLME